MIGSLNLLVALTTWTSAVVALAPLEVDSYKFIVSGTTERFVVVGVDYQPGGQAAFGTGAFDPLSNGTTCLRDAALMQGLGINTIRSYNVDPTLNHDECASIFNAAGIYMIIDVNSPLSGQYMNRGDPKSTYTLGYLEHIWSVIEAFKSYPNTLGFFAGNEVINDIDSAFLDPPYLRAVQRDMKNYIAKHSSRTIPVGYSAADFRQVLQDTWAYLQCNNSASGEDMSRADFFGLNSYSWCGSASSYTTSGYNQLVEIFNETTIPVFFSEYGCIKPLPREFDEVPTLYGPLMTALSGGLVFEWNQEVNDYGLVNTDTPGSLSLLSDYITLKSQYAKVDFAALKNSQDNTSPQHPPACGPGIITDRSFNTSFSIPAPPAGADQIIANGLSNPPSGRLVDVTQTNVQIPVYATNGAPINGLHITFVSEANQAVSTGGAVVTSPSSTAVTSSPIISSPGTSSSVSSSLVTSTPITSSLVSSKLMISSTSTPTTVLATTSTSSSTSTSTPANSSAAMVTSSNLAPSSATTTTSSSTSVVSAASSNVASTSPSSTPSGLAGRSIDSSVVGSRLAAGIVLFGMLFV